jgi:hypothetical protein
MRSEAVAATPSAAAAASRTARGNDAQVTLPVPSGLSDRPRPSGSSANLRVLPWAGFASAVTYSLDDTQPSQIDHWPELKNTGIRMTFYANPSGNWYAGFDTTWQDAIRAGHEIGNHTQNHCHVDLADCKNNLGSVEQEIEQCSSYIKTRLGQADVWTFAFPFGDAGYEAYAKTRFFLARGVQTGTVGPKDLTDPFNLPIIGASGGEAASVFNGHIDTARAQGRWLIFLFHTVLPNSANWYAGVDIAASPGAFSTPKPSVTCGSTAWSTWEPTGSGNAASTRRPRLARTGRPAGAGRCRRSSRKGVACAWSLMAVCCRKGGVRSAGMATVTMRWLSTKER